jgi:hypothetical protein
MQTGFSLRLCPGIGFRYEKIRIHDANSEHIDIRYKRFDFLVGFEFGLFWKPQLDDALKCITWERKMYWPLTVTAARGKNKLKKFLVLEHRDDDEITVNRSKSVSRTKTYEKNASFGCVNPAVDIG